MKNIRGYWFGIAVSLLLAGLVAFLGVVAVSSDNLGWGMAALLSYGVLFGGPLALVLALTWIVYMVRGRGDVPGRVHALLFLPTLLALLIVPVGDAIEQSRRDRFSEAHPAIAETHVNLSGDTVWLDMRQASTSMGASPYLEPASAGNRAFSSFRRYPGPSSGAAFPYEGRQSSATNTPTRTASALPRCRCAACRIRNWTSCCPRTDTARPGCWCTSTTTMPTMSRWRRPWRAFRA